MNLEPFIFSKDEAETAFLLYREQYEKSKSPEDAALMRGYREIAKGREVICLQTVMRAGGLFENGYPKIAIARADQKHCAVTLNPKYGKTGDCEFYTPGRGNTKINHTLIPHGTLPKWTAAANATNAEKWRWDKQTIVPNVPPQHLPVRRLGLYHILWEVESWELLPPIDPALLKELGGGLYSVLATWDLTPLERAVLGVTRAEVPRR